MSNVQELKEAIQNISKKNHVVTEEARYAKDVLFSDEKTEIARSQQELEKKEQLIQEFNVSIKLLMNIFKQSQFDYVMGFLSNPIRLILINMMVAFFRGAGFLLGIIAVAYIFLTIFSEYIPLIFS